MSAPDQRWHRQPIAWLGIAILVGTLAGCIHLIVLAFDYQDPALPHAGNEISFRMPATRAPSGPPPVTGNDQP